MKNLLLSIVLFAVVLLSTAQAPIDNPCPAPYPAGAQWPIDGSCYAMNTNGMSPLFDPGSCNSANRDDAWAWFIGDGNSISVDYTPDTRDAILHVFDATSGCSSIVGVGCSDSGGNGVAENVTFASTNGNQYFVRIQRKNSNWNMTGQLCVSSIPPGGSNGNDCANATILSCGDVLTGETTIGHTDASSSWSCLTFLGIPIATAGEDMFYAINWTDAVAGGTIRINFTNVVDDDTYMELLYLGTSCSEGTCSSSSQFNVSTGTISGSSYSYWDISVPAGIQTHYIVIDSQGNGVTSYDMDVSCFTTGIVVDDVNGCTPIPATAPVNQGVYQTWDGLAAPATADPAALLGTYTICENIYLRNAGWEWLMYFDITLGACWTNISNITPNGTNNGYYDAGGDWAGLYNVGNHEINFDFTYSSGNPWGDGNSGAYTCNLYTFCYDAQVDPNCSPADGFQNQVQATDDGVGGAGGTSAGVVSIPATSSTTNVLPVVLVSFDAEYLFKDNKSAVLLNWVTLSEINNEKFIVEKSIDGINFESIFIVQGAGNTNTKTNYYSVDENPFFGVNYYRLKQIDFDGKYIYSGVISVNNTFKGQVSLFPNPTNTYTSVSGEFKQIEVYDIVGNKVNVEINGNKILGLSAGVFLVVIDKQEPIKLFVK